MPVSAGVIAPPFMAVSAVAPVSAPLPAALSLGRGPHAVSAKAATEARIQGVRFIVYLPKVSPGPAARTGGNGRKTKRYPEAWGSRCDRRHLQPVPPERRWPAGYWLEQAAHSAPGSRTSGRAAPSGGNGATPRPARDGSASREPTDIRRGSPDRMHRTRARADPGSKDRCRRPPCHQRGPAAHGGGSVGPERPPSRPVAPALRAS